MAQVKAFVKQLQGITFAGKTNSNNWVMMDGPENFGGSDAAIRPKELLLLSLGGCTGSDVASILKKKRVKINGFEMNITAEMTEEHPKVYSKMNIEYVFSGKILKKKMLKEPLSFRRQNIAELQLCLKKQWKLLIRLKYLKAKISKFSSKILAGEFKFIFRFFFSNSIQPNYFKLIV